MNTTLGTQRYFLAEFVFDHTFSENGPGTPGVCGGFETPIVIQLLTGLSPTGDQSTWVTPETIQFPFEPGNTMVTVNGQVPALPATWGQIKSAYRR